MKEELYPDAEEDLTAEDEITCPRCKRLRNGGDSFEASDEGEYKCDNCGALYSWSRDVRVTYSTEIINQNA